MMKIPNLAHLFDLEGNFVATWALKFPGETIHIAVIEELDGPRLDSKPEVVPHRYRVFRHTMTLWRSSRAIYEEIRG